MLIFDASELARADGQAVGVRRVLRELAYWALANRADVAFVVYDTDIEAFRSIRKQWIGPIVNGLAMVDFSLLSEATQGKRQRTPRPLLGVFKSWLRNPRRRAFMVVERIRLTAAAPFIVRLAERLRAALLSERYKSMLTDWQGRPRTLVPYDLAIGPPLRFEQNDVVLFASHDWTGASTSLLTTQKAEIGFKIAVLCHDVVMLLYPEFFLQRSVAAFCSRFNAAITITDIVLVTSKRTETDLRSYCNDHQLRHGTIRTVPLGGDPPPASAPTAGALPGGLQPGRYALFVSTIEPRKGHNMLFSVWKRLLAEGLPQACGFKLVFVGRRGWLVDDLLARLDADPCVGDTLILLSGVTDVMLRTLYLQAAFCLYPSLYEGYGLPIVESFQYGKAVLASNGGALPEVVGDLSPLLDPRDEDAWFVLFKLWITDPNARVKYEQAIHERFRHSTWPQAAAECFAVVDEAVRSLRQPANRPGSAADGIAVGIERSNGRSSSIRGGQSR